MEDTNKNEIYGSLFFKKYYDVKMPIPVPKSHACMHAHMHVASAKSRTQFTTSPFNNTAQQEQPKRPACILSPY